MWEITVLYLMWELNAVAVALVLAIDYYCYYLNFFYQSLMHSSMRMLVFDRKLALAFALRRRVKHNPIPQVGGHMLDT